MEVKIEVSVVRAIEGSPRRSCLNLPTNSAAKCCASAALPPFPHHKILFPPTTACVISVAICRSTLSWEASDLTTDRCSAIACPKTVEGSIGDDIYEKHS